jgi:RND family efflux transporter MFP subunit
MTPRLTMKTWIRSSFALPGLLLLAGCTQKSQAAVPAAPVAVNVAMPIVRKVTSFSFATGNAQAMQQVDVTPRVRGFLDSINFKDGQRVKGPRHPAAATDASNPDAKEVPGDLLFVIDPRPFVAMADKARADLALNIASEEQAVLRLERLEDALKGNAIPELDVIQQRAIVQQVKAQVASSRATLQAADLEVEFAHIRSPIDGIISRTKVTIGNVVGDMPLATIAQDKPIFVYFSIADGDLLDILKSHPGLRKGTEAVPVEVGLANEPDTYPHQGHLDYVDPFVDPRTGTITVRGVFPNDDDALLPGIFCRVRVPLAVRTEAVLISERAIGTDQGQKYVLLANAENTVEYRRVRLGPIFEGLRVVDEGLKAEDRVIVNGLLRVRAGVKIDPKPGDMSAQPGAAPKPAEK